MKNVKVAITGSNGFIGRNLIANLENIPNIQFYGCDRDTSAVELEKIINDADVIFHFAGCNRPKSSNQFVADNIDYTSSLVDLINSTQNNKLLIYTSSIHAEGNTEYGISKKISEDIIIKNISKRVSTKIYRLPGVFGKWSKPNYNSVVSTFCYNIANGVDCTIHNSNAEITLLYIDDLMANFLHSINLFTSGNFGNSIEYCSVAPVYKISLRDLHNKIKNFVDIRRSGFVDSLGTGIDRALYATFLSYLPIEKTRYILRCSSDERGDFVEFIKSRFNGQVSFLTCEPGCIRGLHFHHTKNERFVVIKGKALFKSKDILTNIVNEFVVSDETYEVVESVPGHAHSITNIGNELLYVLLWTNEIFDPQLPDTIVRKI